MEEGRIAAVGPSATVDVLSDATVHDMPGAYVMPGLIDGHVHFFQSGGLYTRPDALDLRAVRPYAEENSYRRGRVRRGELTSIPAASITSSRICL
ncbi:MAG: hypothetical protein BRD55_01740 [Bacteroidetes bacterium SW_9_63_38]|nr:MAG: hypothetical protein BRD55_01740 [Bacteroidetes bacterium SW_9_63_38]